MKLLLYSIIAILALTIGASCTITKRSHQNVSGFKYVAGYSITLDGTAIHVNDIMFCDTTLTTVVEDYDYGTVTIKSGVYLKKYKDLGNLDPEKRVKLIQDEIGNKVLLLKYDSNTWFLETPITLIRLSKTPIKCAQD